MNTRRIKKADINDLIIKQTDFMSPELNELISKQVINELANSYLYFAMASKCYTASYDGFGKFFDKKSKEEIEHSIKIRDLMVDMNKPIKFYEIPEISFLGGDLIELFKQFLEAEKKTTAEWIQIKKVAEKDSTIGSTCLTELINWFLNEQIEEESEAADLLTNLMKSRGDMGAILCIENRILKDIFDN